MSEVLERVGYGDDSTFRRLFKRHTSLSPRDYRRRFGSSGETPSLGDAPKRPDPHTPRQSMRTQCARTALSGITTGVTLRRAAQVIIWRWIGST